jgi:tRNA(His) 5'-end guanylyltransferase
MSSKDNMSLGDRMKEYYENCYKIKLPRRMPLIIRLDGKAFHTLTRNCEKPFDKTIIKLMDETAKYLCENIQGAQLAYVQSDEISILVHNYKRLTSSAWFDNDLEKIVSVSSGIASSYFSLLYNESILAYRNHKDTLKSVVFDSRAFVLPENEVCNYFIWRQKDWERNSIQMLAQSLYSHKELQNKNCADLNEVCFQKGKNWNDLSTDLKRGRCVIKKEVQDCLTQKDLRERFGEKTKKSDIIYEWAIDNNIPIFSENRHYIEEVLETEE